MDYNSIINLLIDNQKTLEKMHNTFKDYINNNLNYNEYISEIQKNNIYKSEV